MGSLWLVRHGRPRIDPTGPAVDWPLADSCDPSLLALRDSGELPLNARWVSSPEPKAHATATVLRRSAVEVCDDLAEQRRGSAWWSDPADFAATVRRAVEHPDVPAVAEWETSSATRRRVSDAVRGLLHDHSGLVLVGHGTAWTLLVAELTGAEPDLTAWEAMRMPDVCGLDVAVSPATVFAPWGSVGPTA